MSKPLINLRMTDVPNSNIRLYLDYFQATYFILMTSPKDDFIELAKFNNKKDADHAYNDLLRDLKGKIV